MSQSVLNNSCSLCGGHEYQLVQLTNKVNFAAWELVARNFYSSKIISLIDQAVTCIAQKPLTGIALLLGILTLCFNGSKCLEGSSVVYAQTCVE